MNPQDLAILDGPVGLLFKYFWVAFIVGTIINARMAWNRSVQPKIDAKPELEEGYRSLYRGSLVWMNVPWALMGVGIVSGRVGSVHEYLIPSAGNPNVVLWWGAMGVLLLLGTFWIFTGGAERLAAHTGLSCIPLQATPRRIKVFWLAGCAWNGVFAIFLFSGIPFNVKNDEGIAAVFPIVFPFFFVGMWLLVGFTLGQMSGWAGLSKLYPQEPPYKGPVVSTSGKVGMVSHNGVIHLGVNETGLHLSVLFLFRVGHPPLSIPWSSIQISTEKIFFTEYVRFTVDQTILSFRKKDIQRLARKQKLPFPLEHLGM